MKKIYTIKTFFGDFGLINQSLYQGRGTQNELSIKCRGALDKRIDYVMRGQVRKLERNPKLDPIIKTIKIEIKI